MAEYETTRKPQGRHRDAYLLRDPIGDLSHAYHPPFVFYQPASREDRRIAYPIYQPGGIPSGRIPDGEGWGVSPQTARILSGGPLYRKGTFGPAANRIVWIPEGRRVTSHTILLILPYQPYPSYTTHPIYRWIMGSLSDIPTSRSRKCQQQENPTPKRENLVARRPIRFARRMRQEEESGRA